MRAHAAMVFALALAACSPGEREADAPAAGAARPSPSAGTAQPVAAASASARAESGGASQTKESTELYEFEYAWPAAAGGIPQLSAWLAAQRDEVRGELARTAEAERTESKAGGWEFRPHGHSTTWQVVTETPRFLSLSASVWSFTGGAHGNYWSDALLWDKTTGVRRKPLDLFASPAALSAAIREPFCDVLDKQRAERRGEPVNRKSGDAFDECIDPAEQTVILGSTNRRTFDRLGVLVAPYSAGPYAEGAYEVTLPVTPAVLRAVSPAFRDAFSAR